MKQALFLLVVVFHFACSNDAKVKSESSSDTTAKAAYPTYPYTPSYTSKFEIGNPADSKTILDLYKAWDDGDFAKLRTFFADTVVMYPADGNEVSGPADSIVTASKQYRESFSKVESKVHAWTPLKATEKNENWVLVWYTEYRTDGKGKKDSSEYQETWLLNKAGKAQMVMQYQRQNPPVKK